ncbi:hypothetical protein [Pajaroellobacter abortibovis]|uniref:Uncharacterized protein n=1 Tax=Pajaroellobacter abortibovis TaxID=1882918 RepID=A0A1L6MZ14_9BACT|nr:hypothetical protein [Pajaroellobacter abortibovis]APS00783.1 hypothetical protein BCY86_08905 [Pajaroellobacter abortibovis]
MPEEQVSWLARGRITRLLLGSVSSLTSPDLYAFFGVSIISVCRDAADEFEVAANPSEGGTGGGKARSAIYICGVSTKL